MPGYGTTNGGGPGGTIPPGIPATGGGTSGGGTGSSPSYIKTKSISYNATESDEVFSIKSSTSSATSFPIFKKY